MQDFLKAAFDAGFGMNIKQGDRVLWVTDMGWMMGPFLLFGSLINGATMVMSKVFQTSQSRPVMGDS